ncbi:hypothetical protein J1N35_025457 [Gossypium stocksii]|uniref:Uncharacterized protein n=1 Tax=Gossypium stocksii TaxID=47602 RepID=A0A9D3ZXV1_9ROSI|nr:hypothetical protein J1N35_025457 [Gossypium stocksii]
MSNLLTPLTRTGLYPLVVVPTVLALMSYPRRLVCTVTLFLLPILISAGTLAGLEILILLTVRIMS